MEKILRTLQKSYFSDPIYFFIPYLSLYVIAAALNLSVGSLTQLFVVLHCINFVLLLVWAVKTISVAKVDWALVVFWGVVFLLFFFPGAYLEYPSDPWEHYRRIFSWQSFGHIRDNLIWTKFAYFWSWTILGSLPLSLRRLFVDLYGAFWELLICIQFYRLSLSLFGRRSVAALQALATFFLFGHNIFSFRYYALASTAMSYVAYLSALTVSINFLQKKRTRMQVVPILIATFALCAFNHVQELALLMVSFFALGVYDWMRRFPDFVKSRNFRATLGGVLLAGYLFGWVSMHLHSTRQWINHGWIHVRGWDPFGYVSRFGTFRFWDISGHYFQTLGIHGVFALGLAIIYWKRNRLLSLLTLTPTALMLFPPFALLTLSLTEAPNTYRILYAFPTSLILVDWIIRVSKKVISNERISMLTALLVVAIVGLPPQSPWRGRLWFQFYKPSPMLDLRNFEPAPQWFHDHLKVKPGCGILSDNMTDFLLTSDLGLNLNIMRNYPAASLTDIRNPNLFKFVLAWRSMCMAIFTEEGKMPPVVPSLATRLSGHWTPESQNMALQIPKNFNVYEDLLKEQGWKRFDVPPFYHVYIEDPCPVIAASCL